MGLLESISPGSSSRAAEVSRAVGVRVDWAWRGDQSRKAAANPAAAPWHQPDHDRRPDQQCLPDKKFPPAYAKSLTSLSTMSYAVMSGCNGVTEVYPDITAS